MMKAKRAVLCLLLLSIGAFFASGCGVSLQQQDIARLELTILSGSHVVTRTEGLRLGRAYTVKIVAHTTSGKVITNPKYRDIYLESPNQSVLSKLSWTLFGGYKLITSSNSARLRAQEIQFFLRIKNNRYRSPLFRYSIDWPIEMVHVFRGMNGRIGDSGSDGEDGADQDGDIPPEDGEHGEAGQDGADGQRAPDIQIYASYVEDQINGKPVRGLLYKLVVAGRSATYHYSRKGIIRVKSLGGDGGRGGDGGHGGNGGHALEVDPEMTPPDLLFPGGRGGHGGDGGNGGLGGDGGHITLYFYGDVKPHFELVSAGGHGAAGGAPGGGGNGGQGSIEKLDAPDGNDGQRGRDGRDGIAGRIQAIPISQEQIYRELQPLKIRKEQLVQR